MPRSNFTVSLAVGNRSNLHQPFFEESKMSYDGVSRLNSKPIHQARRLKAIIIGGGPSGLLMAYKLRRHFINLDWTLYEKNADIGGAWFENRYPGCRCDNPAHTYVWVCVKRRHNMILC